MTAAVVLAAGFSRRMGNDKLGLLVDGRPMYTHSIDLVCAWEALSDVVVVTNQPDIAAYAEQKGARVCLNPRAQQGMGTSVAAGCSALSEQTDFCVFLTADQPYLTREILQRLIGLANTADCIAVPRVDGVAKSPCVFPKRFFAQCKALSGDSGGKGIYQAHMEDVKFVDFADSRAWQDIDTPEDYSAIISG